MQEYGKYSLQVKRTACKLELLIDKLNKSVAMKIKFHLFVHSVSQQILACNHIDMSSVQNQVYNFRYFCMDHSHNETKKHD